MRHEDLSAVVELQILAKALGLSGSLLAEV